MRLLILLLLFIPLEVFGQSEPIYEASGNGIRIVVYKEKCKLEAVSNLPWRAVWYQDGKEVEGCIGAKDELGVVVAYFVDKSIVVLPQDIFRKVVGV